MDKIEIELIVPFLPEKPKTCFYCDDAPTSFPDREVGAPFALCDSQECHSKHDEFEEMASALSHQSNIDDFESGNYILDGVTYRGGKPV